jgi:glycosyltransferase involved in cell wall biosynthesis
MPYLTEALDSLERQSFRDFEVCLWDNGSTDGSVEEARRWILGRLKGRVVTGNPLPLHECLARMVEEAKMEFVARMDGDDVCLPERFRLQTDFLMSHAEVALLGGQIRCISPDSDFLPQGEWARYALTHSDIVSRMMVLGPFNHPSIMFRRSAVVEVGNYQVPAPVEDHNLYLKLVQLHRVANLPEVLTHYRIHPASICAGAGKGGLHNRLALESTARESPRVFGIESDTFLKMRSQKHPFVFLPLLKSAFFRSSREKISSRNLLGSREFILVARYMIQKNDFVSKALMKVLSFC